MALTVSLLLSRMMSSHQGMPEDLSTIVFIERSGGDKTQSYTKSTAVLRLFRFEPYKHTHTHTNTKSIPSTHDLQMPQSFRVRGAAFKFGSCGEKRDELTHRPTRNSDVTWTGTWTCLFICCLASSSSHRSYATLSTTSVRATTLLFLFLFVAPGAQSLEGAVHRESRRQWHARRVCG